MTAFGDSPTTRRLRFSSVTFFFHPRSRRSTRHSVASSEGSRQNDARPASARTRAVGQAPERSREAVRALVRLRDPRGGVDREAERVVARRGERGVLPVERRRVGVARANVGHDRGRRDTHAPSRDRRRAVDARAPARRGLPLRVGRAPVQKRGLETRGVGVQAGCDRGGVLDRRRREC